MANLCVPYFAKGFAPDVLVDRSVYPEAALDANGFFGPDSWYMTTAATSSSRPGPPTAAS